MSKLGKPEYVDNKGWWAFDSEQNKYVQVETPAESPNLWNKLKKVFKGKSN